MGKAGERDGKFYSQALIEYMCQHTFHHIENIFPPDERHLQVDLGEERTVRKIVLNAAKSSKDYPRGYEVYISHDGEEWLGPIAAGKGEKALTNIVCLPRKTRYVRIKQTGNGGKWWWSVYDLKILVERAVNAREIECSVLGNEKPEASTPGEVVPNREFYDYRAKYIDDASELIIPAPIPPETAEEVRRTAVAAFRALDCAGMARVDFLLDRASGELYLNELNTIPGFTSISMYNKLWEASGVGAAELVVRLVQLALEKHRERKELDLTPRVDGRDDEGGH